MTDRTRMTAPATPTTAARARRLWELGAFERARDLLDGLPPDELDATLARGDFHLHVGDVARALAAYEQAARLAPGSVHAVRGQAAARLNLGQPAEALNLAVEAHAMAEATPDVSQTERANVLTMLAAARGLMAQRGGFLSKLRHGPGVRAGFERALALDPSNPYARTGLGRYYLAAPPPLGGDPHRALAELEVALAHAPFYYLIHAWYLRALEAAGACPEAARQRVLYRERYACYPGALAELGPG